ncbi:hypothetical protein B0H10DRAFT_2049087 [Mycena sp. CBHHK59/15]|nr:hypothetical protein B0H10DRAFT_2049087 [Mycena sp. CBHHK59/15]
MEVFGTRCWRDSAGVCVAATTIRAALIFLQLTYAHQLRGLLAYNVSAGFLLYVSDYPYLPAAFVDPAFAAIATSPFLDDEQKQTMRSENVKILFSGKISF